MVVSDEVGDDPSQVVVPSTTTSRCETKLNASFCQKIPKRQIVKKMLQAD